jgi:hypothetical protein
VLQRVQVTQLGSPAIPLPIAGRKRAASGAATGSGRRGPVPRPLASANDFSPSHFDEPNSDLVPPSPHRRSTVFLSPRQRPDPASPMSGQRGAVDSSRPSTPHSSPVLRNPLLQQGTPMVLHTPLPSCRSPSFRTQDGNAAWAAAAGMFPIQKDFNAPGFVPAQLVGAVTYTVRSPTGHFPPTVQRKRSTTGRQLFMEYGDQQQQAPPGVSFPAAADQRTAFPELPQRQSSFSGFPPAAATSDSRPFLQKQRPPSGQRYAFPEPSQRPQPLSVFPPAAAAGDFQPYLQQQRPQRVSSFQTLRLHRIY